MSNVFRHRVIPFLALIRWPNLLIIVLTQVLFRYAVIDRIYYKSGLEPAMSDWLFGFLVAVTVLIAAAGYIINDYFDIKTDQVNHPGTVILDSKIHRRQAIKLHIILNGIALAIGVFLSWKAGALKLTLIFILIIALLWLYSSKYKRSVVWGNLAIAFLSAMVVAIVWLFEFYMQKQQVDLFLIMNRGAQADINRYAAGYVLFAFLISLMREIVKDIEDMKGDAETGCRTLPVVHGVYTAKIIAFLPGITTIAIIFLAIMYLISARMRFSAVYFTITVLFPLLFLLYKLILAVETHNYRLISNVLKLIMLAGILGLIPLAMAV